MGKYPAQVPEGAATPADRPLTIRDAAIAACVTSAVVHAVLAPGHISEQPLVGVLFGAAAAALLGAAYALTRPSVAAAPAATAALFVALLAAYPVTLLASGVGVDTLGVATKVVEAVGLATALAARRARDSFASADVLVGVFVGLLLLSLGTHTH